MDSVERYVRDEVNISPLVHPESPEALRVALTEIVRASVSKDRETIAQEIETHLGRLLLADARASAGNVAMVPVKAVVEFLRAVAQHVRNPE